MNQQIALAQLGISLVVAGIFLAIPLGAPWFFCLSLGVVLAIQLPTLFKLSEIRRELAAYNAQADQRILSPVYLMSGAVAAMCWAGTPWPILFLASLVSFWQWNRVRGIIDAKNLDPALFWRVQSMLIIVSLLLFWWIASFKADSETLGARTIWTLCLVPLAIITARFLLNNFVIHQAGKDYGKAEKQMLAYLAENNITASKPNLEKLKVEVPEIYRVGLEVAAMDKSGPYIDIMAKVKKGGLYNSFAFAFMSYALVLTLGPAMLLFIPPYCAAVWVKVKYNYPISMNEIVRGTRIVKA